MAGMPEQIALNSSMPRGMSTGETLNKNPVMSPKQFSALQDKLESLQDNIIKLCGYSGTPSLSLGVLHHGKILWYGNFGVKNLETQSEVDENTVYHIASVGKFITSYALGILIKEGKLDWNDPIKKHLPEFHHEDENIEKMTILHCLTHQTGLIPQNRLWLAERARMNFTADQLFDCIAGLTVKEKPGEKWRYSNWGYALIGRIIARVSGQTWGEFLNNNVFVPLRMHHTCTDNLHEDENTACGYLTGTDGKLVLNGRPDAGDNAIMAGASGVQSCVSDLLSFYKALLEDLDGNQGSERIVPDLEMLTKRHVDLGVRETGRGGEAEQSYSLGWTRTELPGVPSMNPRGDLIIGQAEDKTILWHHNGNYPGYCAASYLLPSTQTAVIVLTNSVGKLELPDLVGQMVIDTILGSNEKGGDFKIDWVGYAASLTASFDAAWAAIPRQLDERKMKLQEESDAKTHSMYYKDLPLREYAGKYYNKVRNWYMELWCSGPTEEMPQGSLWMCMQGNRRESVQRYRVTRLHEHTFSWFINYDESARRGRSPICSADYYVLKFEVDPDEMVVKGMVWNSGDGDAMYDKDMAVDGE